MHLKRLSGSKSKALEDLVEQSLILELKNGRTFGGRLADYHYDGGGVIALYSCKMLDKKNHRWTNNNAKIRNGDGDFWLSEIRNILILPEELRETIVELDDFLQIYHDQHYKAPIGIRCDWGLGRKNYRHHPDCDYRLHEALAFMRTRAHVGKYPHRSKEKPAELEVELEDSFDYVRRRLLAYGAKIP
jgi:hypothetical protein